MVKGTPGELKALPEVRPEGTRRVAVESMQPPQALRTLKELPFTLDATLVESEVHLLIKESTADSEILQALDSSRIKGASIRPIEPSLEDVFVTLTRRLQKQ